MQIRKTVSITKSKKLINTALILVCILCFAEKAFSDDKRIKKGNTITYRGNVFEMKTIPDDTIIVVDPETNEEKIVISHREAWPVLLNSEKIYVEYETDERGFTSTNITSGLNTTGTLTAKSIKQLIIESIQKELSQLEDGEYHINIFNIVIDKNGKIVYYDYNPFSASLVRIKINKQLQTTIDKKIIKVINNIPPMSAATISNKPIAYNINNAGLYKGIIIQKGKIIDLLNKNAPKTGRF